MIAIDQDPLGKQGKRIRDDGDIEVWTKELSENKLAVALLNRSSEPADITVTWEELGIKGTCKIRDLWKHKNLGRFKHSFTGSNIGSHEAMVVLIK
jgi:alpha-galactosidase